MADSNEARTVTTGNDHASGKLDVSALVLVAILLAAGFILNLTIGNAFAITGIKPEFIIAAYCLAILLIRPKIGQAVLIGILAATVIQITTSIPGVEYLADIPASAVMGAICLAATRKDGKAHGAVPLVAGFVTTSISGLIFATFATCVVLGAPIGNVAVMLPIVFGTAAFNAIIVQALYIPLSKAVKR